MEVIHVEKQNILPHLDPPCRPPCTALSDGPLNAIWQVNKHHRGPPCLSKTGELGMPQTGPVGGDVWGVNEELWWGPRWGCCLHIPVVGQMRRPCRKPPPPDWEWNFRSYCLIERHRRKWNFTVNLKTGKLYFIIFGPGLKVSRQLCAFIEGIGISSINNYIQHACVLRCIFLFGNWEYHEKKNNAFLKTSKS